jgi:3-deoxy-D-manno-octulosonic acid kinase
MGISAAAVERQQPFRDDRGEGAIVFDPARLRQASPDMLDVGHYGAAAEAVQAGGRGAAWFVRAGTVEGVLRRYRRGGMAARFSGDRYLWLGEARVRSLAEFRLLSELRAEGLPVPAPLLAGYWRRGFGYRAAILVERIPAVRPLADWRAPGVGKMPWEAVGEMLAAFHRAGVDHADLNANNVLVDSAGKPWLIDFDRCRRRSGSHWRAANLRRLERSLQKLSGEDTGWRTGFASLVAAYRAAIEGAGP